MRLFFACRPLVAVVMAMALVPAPLRAVADDVTIFAAASLTNALDQVAQAWMSATGHRAVMAYAGTSALARQIQGGAPVDIFISASVDWMDEVERSGDLRAGTRRDILGNTLVLIAHGSDAQPVIIDETLDLAGMLGGERLSMALVDAVPAGIYGRTALIALGLWDAVAPMVAQSYSVRTALAFVALGEAPLGIVYATDAVLEDNVSVIGTFPADSHPPIILPVALTAQATSSHAPAFMDFLSSDTARAIWSVHGFDVLD